jgi:hypothetical protein
MVDGITLSGSRIALGSDSQLDSAGDLLVTSRVGDIVLGTAEAGGQATVNSAGILNSGSFLQTGGNATLTAVDDLFLRTLTVGGDLDIDSTTGSILFAGPVQAQAIDVLAATGLEVQSTITGSSLLLNAGAGSLIAADSSVLTSMVDGITLSGSRIALGSDSQLDSAGDLLVTSRVGDIVLGTAEAGGRATVNSAGSVLFTSAVNSTSDLNIQSTATVSVAAAARIASGGKVDIDAASLAMDAASRLDSAGQMRITTAGDMQLSALQTGWNDVDAVRLNSGGTIAGRKDAPVHLSATGPDAQGSISAVTGIGNPLVIDMPWLSAETLNGDINIVAEQGLYSPFLRAPNGNVTLRVNGGLTFGELVGNPYLWVDGAIDGDSITMKQGELAARKGLAIDQINLNGGGPLTLAAPTIDVGVDSKGAANTFMALSGFEGVSANQINVRVVNTGKLNIGEFKSNKGSLSVDGDLNLAKAMVLDSLDMQTVSLNLSLDNYDPRPLDVTGQLMSPDAEFWLDTRGFELRTSALVTRYRDPLVMFFFQPGTPPELQQLSDQRVSVEYTMQTRLSELPLLENGLNIPGYSAYSGYSSPVSLDSQTINTEEQSSNEGADLPPDEPFLEISSR